MNEPKIIKILRLIVFIAVLALCGFGCVELTKEAINEESYALFIVVALCLGAIVAVIINLVNIFKNWDLYWKS